MKAGTRESLPASPARRTLLIAGAGIATLSVGSVAWIGSRLEGTQAWIESVVREHLPGIELDPQSLMRFASSFAENRAFQNQRSKLALMLDQGVPISRRVSKIDRRVERLERRVVTEYLMGSNFFRVQDPRKETIFYAAAMPACGNPFAVLRNA